MYNIEVYKEIIDPKFGNKPLAWYLAGSFSEQVDAEAQRQRFLEDGIAAENIRIIKI